MRILSQRCICPVCRQHFTAFLAECENPQRDEVDRSQRALLCVVCERAFINSLYHAMRHDGAANGEFPISGVRLSALCPEAQGAGESGQSAQVGTDNPRGLSAGLQGMSDSDRNTAVSHRVSEHVDATPETLRGATLLPPDPVGEEGVM